jgi:hypothetical protein
MLVRLGRHCRFNNQAQDVSSDEQGLAWPESHDFGLDSWALARRDREPSHKPSIMALPGLALAWAAA